MSNSSCPPENAAPAALVSPERAAGTDPSSSSFSSPPPHPPPVIPPAPPLPLALSSAPHPGPDFINTDAPPPAAPGPAPGPPAAQEEATSSTVPPPATPAPQHGTTHADQIKYARGPAVLQRPQGPSLLTQALATARGIPRHSSSQHIDSSAATQSAIDSSHHPPSNRDVKPRDPRHGLPHHGEGDVLAQRVSPRKPTMPSLTSVATTVAPPTFGRLDIDLGEVNSMLNGHREFLAKAKDREGDFKNRLGNRANTFAADTSSGHALFVDSPTAMYDGHADENTAIEDRPALRTWKTENRVSLGPEKAWSIGTGELDSDQDGQVEKSITQALAGHEPNARSRKASHSLRFFKEGLPEEKVKRKETRPSTHREKPLATGDIKHEGEGQLKESDVNKDKARDLDEKAPAVKGPPRVKTIPAGLRTPDAVETIEEAPEDYFVSKHTETSLHASPVKSLLSPCKPAVQDRQHLEPTEPSPGLEQRRKSDASTGGGDSAVDEGDESGEEKISSAVFVPHQAPPEQPAEHIPVPGVPPRKVPARTQSRHDDFHPWLVKADEPEFDENGEEIVDRKFRSEPIQSSSVAPELDITQPDGPVATDESGVVSARPFRPVFQHHEEAVHDHQWEPRQPLEAIELIPYKHQVGGHTTLWRFSKRAVCKQLNNRENEFYEKIEHHHRDLLAFLPRYIGVLNVTFQKQSRRKSTMKRDEHAALDRQHTDGDFKANGTSRTSLEAEPPSDRPRVISQSLQNNQGQIPTVTFVDNQHILPRSLLQPSLPSPPSMNGRFRSASAATLPHTGTAPQDVPVTPSKTALSRPSLSDRHANSWGATTVNKRLRNEVFNDAFLKQPIAIHRHRKGHQRPMPRRTLQQSLRPTGSDPSLAESHEKRAQAAKEAAERRPTQSSLVQTQSDLGQIDTFCDAEGEEDEGAPKDVTGTSAPEPEIFGGSSPAALKKKRRYSGTGLRRKPDDVRDDRGNLKYFEEADEVGYKGPRDELVPNPKTPEKAVTPPPPAEQPVEATINGGGEVQHPDNFVPAMTSAATSGLPSPASEFKKIPRPINPKEAQTQSDSRVEYFLLLEDLTAGMKRPCIMDLKMGTRQYGVDANPKKQQSQKGKCAKTTSRELGVRVCGLQVWDVQTQSYVFRDKYYGRTLKKGGEFQGALTRFLYDGVDPSSILRHIPTVLRKLDELEVIVGRLKGYRFYAASLLMFYDGDTSADNSNGYETMAIDDSTTDFATDTEEAPRRQKKSKRDIDFKIADFANCITPYDPMEDKACPPRHPGEPDRGFMRGLHSLRMYFLKIQRDTRAQMGLISSGNGEMMGYPEEYDDEGSVSE
ncbi:hypothetical protein QBC36DRAFT_354084 [Triangularia setosa]|uniref:Kinase n=1 Tax=Triangularia setosa TaxID=2587417 RepID=A0AAN6W5D7_9PEZI|nr:hypothetical protein QBC36DRAFT_354084 [Podospora setosa]